MNDDNYIKSKQEMIDHPLFRQAEAICQTAGYKLFYLLLLDGSEKKHPVMAITNPNLESDQIDYYPEIILNADGLDCHMRIIQKKLHVFESIEQYNSFVKAQNDTIHLVIALDSILSRLDEWPKCKNIEDVLTDEEKGLWNSEILQEYFDGKIDE